MKKFLFSFVILIIVSCSEDNFIPKPPTHLMVDLPAHAYQKFSDTIHYSFDIPKIWSKTNDPKRIYNGFYRGHRRDPNDNRSLTFYLGDKINGEIHFQYTQIDSTNTLSKLVFETFKIKDEHKMRSQNPNEIKIIDKKRKVYGILFEFIGNSAVNFEFLLTDSTKNFVRSGLELRTTPNYDSLQPTLNYIKTDLIHLINTFQWEEKK